MAETLEAFLKRQLRNVDESGKSAAIVRLVVAESGQQFDSWPAPLREEEGGPGPEKMGAEIEELCHGYGESFPSGKQFQMVVVVEDRTGNERGRYIKTVFGKNASAKAGVLGGDMSIAEGARVHVETTKGLLNTMVANYNVMGQQLKAQMESNQVLMMLLMNERLTAANSPGAPTEIDPHVKFVMEKMGEAAGPLAEFAMKLLEKSNRAPSTGGGEQH